MPRIVATHTVEDVKHWASKGDERVEVIGPFATEVVSYVAADGSNQVAVSANVHNMEGMMAFSQTPKAAANMEKGIASPLDPPVELPSPSRSSTTITPATKILGNRGIRW